MYIPEDWCVLSLLEGHRESQIIMRMFLGGSIWVPQKAELVRGNLRCQERVPYLQPNGPPQL